ncbi:MAG: alpha/beta fold hydrolase, partial [Planctomycetes bacterium]|nr:alpha/beta fold hydrolase [Planctomycetota bacterium]
WVVVIHGHGSRGAQLFTRPDIRDLWLPCLRNHRFNILTPDLRGNAWMSPAAVADCAALVAHLRQRCGARRILFASGSMGGTSNLIYATLRPQDVDGVVALCPATDLANYHRWASDRATALAVLGDIAAAIASAYGETAESDPQVFARHSALMNSARLTMPLWIAHGDADAIIPVEQSRALMAQFAGRAVSYREIAGGDHEAPIALMPDAIAWMLDAWRTDAGSDGRSRSA